MIGGVGVHRSDETNIVDMLGGFGKNLTDLNAAFAIFMKLEGDPMAAPVCRSVVSLESEGKGLPSYFANNGLGSKVST